MKFYLWLGILLLCFGLDSFSVQAANLDTNYFQSSQGTNTLPVGQNSSGDFLATLLRLIGALMLVIAVLLGGAWLFKKSRLLSVYQGKSMQLRVIESRSLGHRNSLMVVGYNQQRFLVGVSNNAISLLSPLPDSAPQEADRETKPTPFSEHLKLFEQRKA